MPKGRKEISEKSAIPKTATPSLSVLDINGPVDCCHFTSPHQYSEQTIGLSAFFLRKGVGDVNFSALLNSANEFADSNEQASHFVTLFEEAKRPLSENDVSIEKCLMFNRWIVWIQEDPARFATILSHVRNDMKTRLVNDQIKNTIVYPTDFQQQNADFDKRIDAQYRRRLFCFNQKEMQEPSHIISLQNRITSHLSFLVNSQMNFNTEFRGDAFQEMINILNNSILIMDHPRSGANPVLIYERIRPGMYRAKVSVLLVSLLHDFMVTHPNVLKFYDIEVSLQPSSTHYQLEGPRSISWHTCRLNAPPHLKDHMIQYAELSFINIQQASPKDNQVHFAQAFHHLHFSIRFHMNINDQRCSRSFVINLKSLSFIIGAHTNQIPQLLTRVIFHDIKTFSKPNLYDLNIIKAYLMRYFIHHTGVEPNAYTIDFLEKQLVTALNERKDFKTLEDIYMDVLVPIVHQIEFMAKHPILAMLYVDKLFLGPCDGEDVVDTMNRSSNVDSHKVALRFNSTKVDYKSIAGKPVLGRVIQLKTCHIRVDIYHKMNKTIKHYTLDSSKLLSELTKLIRTAYLDEDDDICILSKICDRIDKTTYKALSELGYYYDKRLEEISKSNEIYRHLIDLKDLLKNDASGAILGPQFSLPAPTSLTSVTSDDRQDASASPCIIDPQQPSENILSLKKEDLVQFIQSDPEFYADLLQKLCRIAASPTIVLNQIQDSNSVELHPMDEITDVLEPNPAQIDALQSIDWDFGGPNIDIGEFLSRDPGSTLSNSEDLHSSFDDPTIDIPPRHDD